MLSVWTRLTQATGQLFAVAGLVWGSERTEALVSSLTLPHPDHRAPVETELLAWSPVYALGVDQTQAGVGNRPRHEREEVTQKKASDVGSFCANKRSPKCCGASKWKVSLRFSDIL